MGTASYFGATAAPTNESWYDTLRKANQSAAPPSSSGLTDGGAWRQGTAYNGAVPADPNTGAPIDVKGWITPTGGGSGAKSGSSSTPTPWTPYSPPGYGENYWNQTSSQWQQPGASSQYWNGQQGYFAGPTPQESSITDYGNQLGNNSGALENLYSQYQGNGTFSNPGQSEQWYAQNGGAMNRAGAGESAIGNLLPQYGQAGAAEQYYTNNVGQLGQPGAMEQFNQQNGGQLLGPSALAQNQGGIARDINSAHSMGNFWNATGGQLARQGYAEHLANQGGPQSSYSEDLMNNGTASGGLDSLYNRLYETGARRLDSAAAARGGFNSGASLRLQEEMGKDLDAQHVRDYMAAAGQADTSAINRLGYGLNLANSGDSAMRDRLNLGFQGATGADQTALARAGASQGLYQGINADRLANLGLAGSFANNAQSQGLNRIQLGGTLAQNSQADMLARLNGGVAAGNAMDSLAQNRFSLGSGAAHTAQSDTTTRNKMALDAANSAQTQNTNRLTSAGNLQSQAQQDALQRLLGGGTLATSASTDALNRLTGGQNAANSAQTAQQNRENSTYDNLFRQAQAQGQTYANGMNTARNEQMQAAYQEINGILQKGQNASAAEQQRLQQLLQLIQMPIAAATTVSGLPSYNRQPLQNTSAGSPTDWNNFLG